MSEWFEGGGRKEGRKDGRKGLGIHGAGEIKRRTSRLASFRTAAHLAELSHECCSGLGRASFRVGCARSHGEDLWGGAGLGGVIGGWVCGRRYSVGSWVGWWRLA